MRQALQEPLRENVTTTPEKRLWQAVIYNAVVEATNPEAYGERGQWQREADTWLRRGSDLHVVCALAGMDPDFVREAYISGKIDRELLKRQEKVT